VSKFHRVGDIVRLAKGWTPMTVIGITPDNEVIAQYGTCPDREDLRHPEYAQSTYTRPHYGFVQWDGAPVKGPTMAKRYQIIDTQFCQFIEIIIDTLQNQFRQINSR
jgi:hypothetical protein